MNQNSKIQNQQTPVPETLEMNDKDFLTDLLSTEKYLASSFNIAMNEASHDALYQDIFQVYQETQTCQRDLYNKMFQKGWYGVEAASPQTLQQSHQEYTTMGSQLPHGNMTH